MFGATVVFEPVNQIAKARNTGAKAASGKYLIFLDADTTIHGDIFDKVLKCLSSGKVVGGGAWTEPNSGWFGRFLFKYFINYLLALKNVTVGPFLYCDKDAFDAVGGFDEELYAAEEFSLAQRLKEYGHKHGKKWHIIKHAKGHRIITSNRKFENYGGLEMLVCNAHLLIGTKEKLKHKEQCDFWYKPH
jgi:glycosyltransferase involved in cell wall biosynthesis